jgi:hypothetical protein
MSQATYNLLVSFLVLLVPTFISVVLYLAPKKESKLRAEQYRTAILENLFYNSLFLTLGGWISFFTGDYIYIIIAFLIGGLNFLRDLLQYVFKVKKIIDHSAKIEEIIIENYDYIVAVFNTSSSYLEFEKKIKSRFPFSNDTIFNLYNSFKNFKEEREENRQSSGEENSLSKAYKLLGVTSHSTKEEVRRVFREKARELHPDFTRNNDDTQFKELNNAYQIIMETFS